jgi:hypothetical protein
MNFQQLSKKKTFLKFRVNRFVEHFYADKAVQLNDLSGSTTQSFRFVIPIRR